MGIELYRVNDEVFLKTPISSEAFATGFALELPLLERWKFANDHSASL